MLTDISVQRKFVIEFYLFSYPTYDCILIKLRVKFISCHFGADVIRLYFLIHRAIYNVFANHLHMQWRKTKYNMDIFAHLTDHIYFSVFASQIISIDKVHITLSSPV